MHNFWHHALSFSPLIVLTTLCGTLRLEIAFPQTGAVSFTKHKQGYRDARLEIDLLRGVES